MTELSRRELLRGGAGAVLIAGMAQSARAQDAQRHTVDMTDQLVFDPDSITIAPGDTIVWENVGNIGHSVTAYEAAIPEEAEYFASGGFDTEQTARSAYSAGNPESGDIGGGDSFEHTFDAEGDFEYFCVPHESAGMVGSVVVTPGGASEDGAIGPIVPQVPEAARAIAIAATFALISVIGLAYVFLKYGGDYEITDEDE